jgi:hypothetical protein
VVEGQVEVEGQGEVVTKVVEGQEQVVVKGQVALQIAAQPVPVQQRVVIQDPAPSPVALKQRQAVPANAKPAAKSQKATKNCFDVLDVALRSTVLLNVSGPIGESIRRPVLGSNMKK